MFKIINFDRYDRLINNLLLANYFIYIFSIEISASSIFTLMPLNYIFKFIIRLTFIFPFIKVTYDFIRGKWLLKELTIYLIFGILFLIVRVFSSSSVLFLTLVYIMAFKNVNHLSIFKYSFFALFLSFILIILSGFCKFVPDYSRVAIRYGIERTRYNLGFYDHIGPHTYFLSIVIMYFLYIKELKRIHLIVILLLNIFLFVLTDSKNHFLCVNILIAIYFIVICKNNDKIYRLIYIFTLFSPILYCVLITTMVFLYKIKVPFFEILNKILTGRLYLSAKGFEKWGITLFGQVTDMGNKIIEYQYVDSSYLNILFNFGIISLIIVILFYIMFTLLTYRCNMKVFTIIIFIVLLNGVIDDNLCFMSYRPFIVSFASILNYYINYKGINMSNA